MLWRRRRSRPADRETLALIRAAASERRILRQELGLPPVTDEDVTRWIPYDAPVSGWDMTRDQCEDRGGSEYRS